MSNDEKKLVPMNRVFLLIGVLIAWAGYRAYKDSQRPEGLDTDGIVSIALGVGIGLVVVLGIAWYGNRPEKGNKE